MIAKYVGNNPELFNKEANIELGDNEGQVLAQFNDSSLGELFVTWTPFPSEDFKELVCV